MALGDAHSLQLVKLEGRVLVELYVLGIFDRKTIHELSDEAIESFLNAPFSQTNYDGYVAASDDARVQPVSVRNEQTKSLERIAERDRVTTETIIHTALVHYLEKNTQFHY